MPRPPPAPLPAAGVSGGINLFIFHEVSSAAAGEPGPGGRVGGPGAAVPGVLPGSGRSASAPARGGGGCGGDASRAAQPGSAGLAGARRPARGEGDGASASAGGVTGRDVPRRTGLGRAVPGPRGPWGQA